MLTVATHTRHAVTVAVRVPSAYSTSLAPVVEVRDTLDRGPSRPYGLRRFEPFDVSAWPLPDLACDYPRQCLRAEAWLDAHAAEVIYAVRHAWRAGR